MLFKNILIYLKSQYNFGNFYNILLYIFIFERNDLVIWKKCIWKVI